MFKHNFSIALAGLAALTLVGCASNPSPQYINGNYFMTGDANCAKWQTNGSNRIMCYTTAGEFTGGRSTMSGSDMQIYQYQTAKQAQEMSDVSASLNALSNSVNQSAQQIRQQSSGWQAPAVNPYPSSSNQIDQIRCIQTGIVTNCRYE